MKKSDLSITTVVVGPIMTNCYVVSMGDACVVIDPGFEEEKIFAALGGRRPTHILLTHGHFDHIGAVAEVKGKTGCLVFLHKRDLGLYSQAQAIAIAHGCEASEPPPPDRFFGEKANFDLPFGIKVMETPGHSGGSVCFILNKHLFSGDTLFAGSIGRTDRPGADHGEMESSLRRLAALDGDLQVYPGHGPQTTLDQERQYNPFLQEL